MRQVPYFPCFQRNLLGKARPTEAALGPHREGVGQAGGGVIARVGHQPHQYGVLRLLGAVQQDWYVFEPDSKGFRVELPRQPNSTSTRTVTGAAGRSQLTSARLRTPQATYSVVVTENRGRVDPNTLDDGIRQFAAARK